MTIIVCGQFSILGDECPGCGSHLHRVRRGGFQGADGWWYCDEDCIADHQEWLAKQHTEGHHASRDLLCACKICVARGLPSRAMLDEYKAYVASIKGTPLDPDYIP